MVAISSGGSRWTILGFALLLALVHPPVVDAQGGPLGPCAAGNVTAGGAPLDVLTLDGTAGGSRREVAVLPGQPFTLGVTAPPGTGLAPFVLYARLGIPGAAEALALPLGIGDMCFAPCILNPQPSLVLALANNFFPEPCVPLLPSTPAPWSLLLPGIPATVQFTLQGAVVDLSQPGGISATNALVASFTACGIEGPTFAQRWSNGSATTCGHYAVAMAATRNDPNPKIIGPGHQYTSSEWAKIRLASVSNPTTSVADYVWSGGDEVGYYRGRLTVDGSTPGIDRIFFVARNTTSSPNFVDWDGAVFSNETTLAPAAGSIQRLWTLPDGDLMGNDTSGRVYRWDKQNAYAVQQLFQFTNTPGSIPWGTSLDLALGQPDFDPGSGLILFPVDNAAISASGQLYGFDLSGVRQLADQDLMGIPLTGYNSYDFGVTVDQQAPGCRVLVHGGRDSDTMFVLRYTDNLQEKHLTRIGGLDTQGGWQGALIGNEFWTNTNTLSYGVVRRQLPADW